jgi:hypothetical protein
MKFFYKILMCISLILITTTLSNAITANLFTNVFAQITKQIQSQNQMLQQQVQTQQTNNQTSLILKDPSSLQGSFFTIGNMTFSHQMASVNGVQLHYVIGGHGDPLVLLHG